MLTKNLFDVTDPKSYSNEKSYRYLVYFGFADSRRPQGSEHRLKKGTVVVVRANKIRSDDDTRKLEADLTDYYKKEFGQWNGARLVVRGFSRYEDD